MYRLTIYYPNGRPATIDGKLDLLMPLMVNLGQEQFPAGTLWQLTALRVPYTLNGNYQELGGIRNGMDSSR
jgi:hypothetical protein